MTFADETVHLSYTLQRHKKAVNLYIKAPDFDILSIKYRHINNVIAAYLYKSHGGHCVSTAVVYYITLSHQ